MHIFLLLFGFIFVAELGDKSQSTEDALHGSHNKTQLKLRIERAVFDYFQLFKEQVNLFITMHKNRDDLMSNLPHVVTLRAQFGDSNSRNSIFNEWADGMKGHPKIPAIKSLYGSFRERAKDAGLPIPFESFHQHFVEKSLAS